LLRNLAKFLRRITLTHTQRYQAKEKPSVGFGEMAAEGGGAIRPGKQDAGSRPPEKRLLTPFFPRCGRAECCGALTVWERGKGVRGKVQAPFFST
jgi:hypothetical protein